MKKWIALILISSFSIFLLIFCNYYKPESESLWIKKLPKAELAYFQAELEYLKTRDPKTGEIPLNIREREIAFSSKIPSKRDIYFRGKNYLPLSLERDWKIQGPANIAGRIKAIAIDVKNENVILAGSASGGLWRSSNGGSNWAKTSSPGTEQSVYCIAQDKRTWSTNTWYYGTGELLSTTNRKFSIYPRTIGLGSGIYKSTDNGISWRHLSSTSVLSQGSLSEVFQGIWRIIPDSSESDNDVVWAACHGGIMKSEDGGESWDLSIGDLNSKNFSTDLDIASNGMLYCALSTITGNGNKPLKDGIWSSSNKGKSWNDITPQGFPDSTRVVKLKVAPSNPNVLYVLTETPIPPKDEFFKFATSLHTFWKYTYDEITGKGTWEDRTKNLPDQRTDPEFIELTLRNGLNTLGGYCCVMNVKPDNENVVFIGGTNLFMSDNAFATRSSKKIGGYNSSVHPDQHAIEFSPSKPNTLFEGTDGGIVKTTDCMSQNIFWYGIDNGLITGQFYSASFDRVTPNDELILGGMQDQGTVFNRGLSESDWFLMVGGDGMDCAVANNKDFFITSIYNGQMWGLFFDKDSNLQGEYSFIIADNMANTSFFNFYTVFDIEPNDNDELYLAAKNFIYRKNNLKQSVKNSSMRNQFWTKMKNTVLPVFENITAIEVSTIPKDRLYFGTDAGKIYRIDNANSGEPSRLDISDDDFPINGYVSCITSDPENADNLFVVFSNYNVQSIFYSSDGGAGWSKQGGNLEENPDGGGAGPSIRSIEILHTQDGTIYFVGTSTGLYSTTNLAGVNTVWVRESEDLIGNIKVDMVSARQVDGFVVVATQGNGIYSTNVKSIVGVDEEINNFDFTIYNYPNPCANETTIDFHLPQNDFYQLDLYDISGKYIEKITGGYFQKGKHVFTFETGNLMSGTYIYMLKSRKTMISGKLVITK